MTNTLFKDGIPYIGAIGQNIARGITPTASGWDTPPSNLENATDGDPDTATGIGSTTLGGAGHLGTIKIDLGCVKPVFVMIRLSAYSDAGLGLLYHMSNQGGTWGYWHGNKGHVAWSNSTFREWSSEFFAYASEVGFSVYVNSAATGYVKIYELIAIEVIP